jgi:nucleotide-binding universal stress UspA family protein
MNNVLVPIDGSAAALRALEHAVQVLRAQPGARVHALNVQAPKIHAWPGKLVSPDMINAELRKDGQRLLVPAEQIAHAAGVACSTHVSIGLPAEEIVAYAGRHQCDGIWMGTRGLGAVTALVIGSVAQQVIHLAQVPVTLVK